MIRELWGKLDARRDTCTGKNCPAFGPCFITGMQQRAKEADLIIVNHHLFFADLALKQDDFGSILPEYSAVVFDEAHEMEDVASDYFGRQISNFRFEELARDADQTLRLAESGNAIVAAADAADPRAQPGRFSNCFRRAMGDFRSREASVRRFWSRIAKRTMR